MRIGIIGTGQIGSTVAQLLREAGHEVNLGARRPEGDAVAIEEAARFGEAVLVAIPYGAWPGLAPRIAGIVAGKIVIDAGNPDPERDGAFGERGRNDPEGSGAPVANLLPDAKLVRSFSTVEATKLQDLSNPATPTVAMPVAGNDRAAVETVASLVRDAGFDPVLTGDLSSARLFDHGNDVFAGDMSTKEARISMGLLNL